MIATALIFALGALLASLVALLFAPIVWGNAQRLARREFEATIPVSVKEMRAEVDAERARSAFEIRREAIRHRAAQESAVRERVEAGRAIIENGQLLARQKELEAQIAAGDTTKAGLDQQLQHLTTEREALLKVRADLRQRLDIREHELHELNARHHALSEHFDEQRFRLATAETRVLELSGTLRSRDRKDSERALGRPAPDEAMASAVSDTQTADVSSAAMLATADPSDRPSGSSRLRAAIARASNPRAEVEAADPAEIRERIGDIAARVIHEQIKVEGPDSELARIIAEAPPEAPDVEEPFLADRVRRLQAAEDAKASPVLSSPLDGRTRGNGAGRSRRKSRR